MALPLDGPRLSPGRWRRAKRQLVVFLHGYGADGNDLISLGREWARALPHAALGRRMRRNRAAWHRWDGNGSI